MNRPPIATATNPREEGIALFVVLVVVIVLTVLVTQLAVTTKIEERISLQHQGFLESTYSLQSVARRLASLLLEDWTADIEGSGGEEDPMAGGDPGGVGGLGGAGGDQQPTESADPIDSRHEDWRHLQEEPLNEWQIEYQINDGESRISLQHIFWYSTIEDDGQNPTPEFKTLWMAAMLSPDPDDEEDDPLDETTPATPPGDGETADDEEPAIIREFQIPSEERIEKTKVMVSRLVEGIIDYNSAHDFTYFDTPSPDAAAEAICEWAIERMRDESSRRIRRLEPLKDLPDIGWELFNGPADPQAEADEEDAEELGAGFGGSLDEFDDFGTIPGYEDLDDGVEEIPRPLGLRHVLTPYSTGRINLNTARPEVIAALLIDIDDYEVAYDIAQAIDFRLNSYIVDEEAEEDETTSSDEETVQEEFNTFTVIDDLKAIDDDDDDIDWEEQTGTYDGDEKKIWDMILAGLRPVAIYKSTYFTAHLTGTREDQTVEGELVVARDEHKIKVLSWREIVR